MDKVKTVALEDRASYTHTMDKTDKNARSVFAWCLYDWGNSAFNTVVITFVYAVYFARTVVGDETLGSAWWSYAIAVSGLAVAVSGPVMGAMADHYGARKPFLLGFSLLCIVPTFLLYGGEPGSSVLFILGLLVMANIGFEMSLIYANAMLPHIAPPDKIGRISGWAWGMGYLGGLVCLVLVLFGLVGLGGAEPWLFLPQEQFAHIRASAPLTALWFAVFTVPLLLYTHDIKSTGLSVAAAVKAGLQELKETARTVRQPRNKNLLMFLIASAVYRDGLNALFAVGGLYAAGTFGMDFEEILIFAIGLNVTAGIGAALFGWLDDRIGAKRTILISLGGLMVCGLVTLLIADKHVFIALALLLGLFIGPVQSASRTFAARLAPRGLAGQTYGLYAFTGKSVAFMGPLAFGLATSLFDSQRAGMATIILFWGLGFLLLTKVKEKEHVY